MPVPRTNFRAGDRVRGAEWFHEIAGAIGPGNKGGMLTMTAGGASETSQAGGRVTVTAGAATHTTSGAGGAVALHGGAGSGGVGGAVTISSGASGGRETPNPPPLPTGGR